MGKHNQYYSDWDETPEDEYYRDQGTRGPYADEHESDYSFSDSTDRHSDAVYQNNPQRYVSGPTDDRRRDDDLNHHYPAPHNQADYYDRESERGFNLVNIEDIRNTDFPAEPRLEIEYYDAPQHLLAHDQQDLIRDITENTKSDGIQVVADDFIDSPNFSNGFRLPKIVTVCGALLFAMALTFWLLYSSQPELSAYEIVQMDSYDGQQATPEIFNLTNLKDCASLSDCIKESLTASREEIAQYTRETSALREIPAVNAAPESAPLINTVEQNFVQQTATEITPPNQLQVKKQWSIIRTTPNANGEIITSLAKGVNVRLLSRAGSWLEIEAINSKGTRGYMHESTISNL